MNNMYNAARIWEAYRTQLQNGVKPNRDSYWWRANQEFKFRGRNNDLSRACYALSWMVAEYTMGGLT